MFGRGLTDQSVQFATDVATIDANVDILERHHHSPGRWFGKDPVDAFLLEGGLVSWQVTAGAGGAYGNWVQLSDGTEIADPRYDPRLILVTQASAAGKLYYVQLGTGAGGAQVAVSTIAAFPAAALRQGAYEVQTDQILSTALLWARCKCETDAATISFVLGLHTYP